MKKTPKKLPKYKPGSKLAFVIQEHNAARAGKHYDVRIGLGNRMHSWAVRYLPKPGQKTAAFRTPDHDAYWAHFQGRIASGYGKGTVRIHKQAPAIVLDSKPTKLTVMLPEKGKVPEQYTLIKPPESNDWLLVNHTTTHKSYPIPKGKPKYRQIEFNAVDFSNPQELFAAKIDGAHAVLLLREGKRPRLFSFRESKRGMPLEYTFKMPVQFYTRTIKHLPVKDKSLIIRGEVFGYSKKTHKVIPARVIGKILNSGISKAYDTMQKEGWVLKFAPFQVSKIGNKNAENLPYKKQLPILKEITKILPHTELPSMAFSRQAKRKLHEEIAKGKHKQTSEGVVIWNLEHGVAPTKAKKYPEFDIYVRRIFKEKGTRKMAGGFEYSITPRGKIVGRVGTGFNHKMKEEMLKYPKKFLGRVAKVRAMYQFPSGALRAPAFREWHLDKTPKTKRETL